MPQLQIMNYAGNQVDKVFIEELKVVARIGVWEWERRITQNLTIDIEFAADIQKAAQSDDLLDALSYKEIAQRVASYVKKSEHRLIETVAQGIADMILDEFPTTWCRITVKKPKAVENSRNVGVTIERSSNN